jgi:hypothetical protein
MHIRLASASILAAAATLAGCHFSLGSSTNGQEGHATFAYVSGDGCFFGCDTSPPLMAGTGETVAVDGPSLPARLTFTSDDPTVLAVTQTTTIPVCSCSQGVSCGPTDPGASCIDSFTVTIQAVAPGDTRLVARAADGSLFDALPLHVAAPASLAFHCSTDSTDPTVTELSLAEDCSFHVDAFDADGGLMQASAGFSITSADPAVVHVRPQLSLDLGTGAPPDPPVTSSDGSVAVAGKGTTRLQILAGAATLTIPVTVP